MTPSPTRDTAIGVAVAALLVASLVLARGTIRHGVQFVDKL